ncbi:AbrB/MazE/SpoVT family DNA-binding domain-containing protein [Pseudomonas veronii]
MNFDLPPELLTSLRLEIGDKLSIEVIDGAIVLRPACTSSPTSCTYVKRFTRLYAGIGEAARGQVISSIFRECTRL